MRALRKNGDTLKDLNERCAFATARKIVALRKFTKELAELERIRNELHAAQSEEDIIRTRLNIWWRENGKKMRGGQSAKSTP